MQQVRLIKDRDRNVITSKESGLKRWKEYFEELLNEVHERENRNKWRKSVLMPIYKKGESCNNYRVIKLMSPFLFGLVTTICQLKLQPEETMVSYDVISLFTCIPTIKAK